MPLRHFLACSDFDEYQTLGFLMFPHQEHVWFIVVISIRLLQCMIKLFTCFTSCLLDRNLIVTLYLSFYYLLYVEDLMCFVQVFQVTSIYVPSVSQLLIILKGRNIKHFQFILFKFIFSFFVLCTHAASVNFKGLCSCRLYGLYQALWFVPCFMQPLCFC